MVRHHEWQRQMMRSSTQGKSERVWLKPDSPKPSTFEDHISRYGVFFFPSTFEDHILHYGIFFPIQHVIKADSVIYITKIVNIYIIHLYRPNPPTTRSILREENRPTEGAKNHRANKWKSWDSNRGAMLCTGFQWAECGTFDNVEDGFWSPQLGGCTGIWAAKAWGSATTPQHSFSRRKIICFKCP